jgi:hypothetical protein
MICSIGIKSDARAEFWCVAGDENRALLPQSLFRSFVSGAQRQQFKVFPFWNAIHQTLNSNLLAILFRQSIFLPMNTRSHGL